MGVGAFLINAFSKSVEVFLYVTLLNLGVGWRGIFYKQQWNRMSKFLRET